MLCACICYVALSFSNGVEDPMAAPLKQRPNYRSQQRTHTHESQVHTKAANVKLATKAASHRLKQHHHRHRARAGDEHTDGSSSAAHRHAQLDDYGRHLRLDDFAFTNGSMDRAQSQIAHLRSLHLHTDPKPYFYRVAWEEQAAIRHK